MLQPFPKSFFCLMFCLLFFGVTSYAQEPVANSNQTVLVAEASFHPLLLEELEVTFVCNSGNPSRLVTMIKTGLPFEWVVKEIGIKQTFCQIYADLPRGFSIEYSPSGDSPSKSDENGCQYADVVASQTNRCLLTVTQDHVQLTVYKKWVGATGDEGDVAVSLVCDGRPAEPQRFLNQGLPATWQITRIPPQGLNCAVSETPDETFISDENDCSELILLPGRGDACTMVNTKVVKRIEMLNRYGKVIMILVMMSAGLIAVRRYV